MHQNVTKIGIISGAGFDQLEGLKKISKVCLETPFGTPSDSIITGQIDGAGIAFLPRHGNGYRLLPHEIPWRANIYALKSLGVETIIAVNSCGSFRDEIKPGEFLVPDQVIDRTQGRKGTFSGEGVIFHISFAEPFCPVLGQVLSEGAKEIGIAIHQGGTCLVTEGPALSSGAESSLYKNWGVDVISMTLLPEAKLAREAQMCYASLCLITYYAAWQKKATRMMDGDFNHIRTMDLSTLNTIIRLALNRIPEKRNCECRQALATAMVTTVDHMTLEQKKRLDLILGIS